MARLTVAGWVLGCHRSGTSLLCSVLRDLSGAHDRDALGPNIAASITNPNGFHESVALVDVNDRLLSWAGRTWDRPFVTPPAWDDPASLRLISQLRNSLSRHDTVAGWIDKDPRLCLTRDAFSHLLLRDPAAIAVIRHPLAVATSLHRRNGFSLRKGAAIWMLYNLHLFNSHSAPPETVLLFDDLVSPEAETQSRVAESLAGFIGTACRDTVDRSGGSLVDQARDQLVRRQRNDLVRSDNSWRGGRDDPVAAMLDEIWVGFRELVRDDRRPEMGPYLRHAWATVTPVVEPEVAIPLHQPRGIGSTVDALRSRVAPLKRRLAEFGPGR